MLACCNRVRHTLARMASQSLQELASLLPGGTYITFTILAQLTTNTTEMARRMTAPDCQCTAGNVQGVGCTNHHVCGAGYFELSISLVAITAMIVFMLAWYGADLKSKKDTVVTASAEKQEAVRQETLRRSNTTAAVAAAAVAAAGPLGSKPSIQPPALIQAPRPTLQQGQTTKIAATHSGNMPSGNGAPGSNATVWLMGEPKPPSPAFVQSVARMSAAELRRKYAELVVKQVIRAVGGVGIFLVLAIFTPPVSTCLLPPCKVPPVVCTVVPLLVSFAVSAFVVIQEKFVHRMVFAWDWIAHPEDRVQGQWSILTSGVKLDKVFSTQFGGYPQQTAQPTGHSDVEQGKDQTSPFVVTQQQQMPTKQQPLAPQPQQPPSSHVQQQPLLPPVTAAPQQQQQQPGGKASSTAQ